MFGKLAGIGNQDKKMTILQSNILDSTKHQQQQKKKEKDKVQIRINDNLKGSKFRLINEFLYTENSEMAFKHFQKNKEDFKVYHEGFAEQTKGWNVIPVQMIGQMISKKQELNDKILIDLGCGTGELYEYLQEKGHIKKDGINKNKNKMVLQKMHSFDLVSVKDFIEVADIKKLNLKDESIDCGVFCLALMGTNYIDFIMEATRVLKVEGLLIISEVTSRFTNFDMFIIMMEYLGYQMLNKVDSNSYFVTVEFQKLKHKNNIEKNREFEYNSNILRQCQKKVKKINSNSTKKTPFQLQNLSQLSKYILKPCVYKRR